MKKRKLQNNHTSDNKDYAIFRPQEFTIINTLNKEVNK